MSTRQRIGIWKEETRTKTISKETDQACNYKIRLDTTRLNVFLETVPGTNWEVICPRCYSISFFERISGFKGPQSHRWSSVHLRGTKAKYLLSRPSSGKTTYMHTYVRNILELPIIASRYVKWKESTSSTKPCYSTLSRFKHCKALTDLTLLWDLLLTNWEKLRANFFVCYSTLFQFP